MATLFDEQSDAIIQAGMIQSQAISNAAAIQMQMAREAIDFQKEQSQIARDTLAPFVTAGNESSQRLKDLLGIGGRAATTTAPSITAEGFDQQALQKAVGTAPNSYAQGNIQNIIAGKSIPDAIKSLQGLIAQGQAQGTDPNVLNGFQNAINSLQQSSEEKTQMLQAGQFEGVTTPGETSVEAQQRVTNELLNDPVFQGQINVGMQALERSAAARGGLQSGRLATDLQAFGQQQAGNYIQQHIQNLSGLASQGVGAAGGSANIAYNTGTVGAGILQDTGNQQANFALGQGQVAAASQLATSPASELAFNLARLQGNAQGVAAFGGTGAFGSAGGVQGALASSGRFF